MVTKILPVETSLIYILILWNIIVFFIYRADKERAKKHKRRISEKTLISLAFFMGGIGAIAGMIVFRHKTKHNKFRILIPVAIIINIVIVFHLKLT